MENFLKGRLTAVRLCLLATVLILVAVGIATIYLVGNPAQPSPTEQTGDLGGFWKKQLIFLVVGLLGFVAANLVNYRRIGEASYWIYVVVLLLLGILLVSRYVVPIPFVPEINGAHRWIRFKIAGWQLPAVQPSELCKLAYILALAWYLRYRSNYRSIRSLVGPFVLTLLPMVMILAQPDLGTVMLMMPVFFAMVFVAGAKIRHLLLAILVAFLVSPLFWFKMKPYQRTRISSVFLQSSWVREKTEQHPTIGKILVGREFNARQWRNDWGYHLIRSKFAVASGGVRGWGFGQGPFVKYNFLPERHNDFIFAVIAHEWGFWGSICLLGLYVIVAGCGLEIAANNTDPFGRFLATGIVAMFSAEVLTNVSMTLGLMPITGLTLPFVSYGGSSLVVSMIAVGLLNNVGRCRPFTVARKS
jgi:rod shape determining protein RodA